MSSEPKNTANEAADLVKRFFQSVSEELDDHVRASFGGRCSVAQPFREHFERQLAREVLKGRVRVSVQASLMGTEEEEAPTVAEVFAVLAQRPEFSFPREPQLARLWKNVCRVKTDQGTGTGFFVNISYRQYVVTCAHVVEDATEISIQRAVAPAIVEDLEATVVAFDHSSDLAVLTYDEFSIVGPEPEGLEFGESPSPGDRVTICGFPLGASTPRLAQGMVSGYETVTIKGAKIFGSVLDASINPGNSGGPVCNEAGQVVGVAFAIPRPLLLDSEGDSIQIKDVHNANAGIGFALDSQAVHSIAEVCTETASVIQREFNKYPPPVVAVDREVIVQLQTQCRGLSHHVKQGSPIGVFSFDSKGNLYLGWSTDSRRMRLDNTGLETLLQTISPTGGSFVLRGHDVVLYRKKYKGFIVGARLQLMDQG